MTAEEVDPTIGFGMATGDYASTYGADGLYEILAEEQNTWGTKKPVDDTMELGWIFTYDLPTPCSTSMGMQSLLMTILILRF